MQGCSKSEGRGAPSWEQLLLAGALSFGELPSCWCQTGASTKMSCYCSDHESKLSRGFSQLLSLSRHPNTLIQSRPGSLLGTVILQIPLTITTVLYSAKSFQQPML